MQTLDSSLSLLRPFRVGTIHALFLVLPLFRQISPTKPSKEVIGSLSFLPKIHLTKHAIKSASHRINRPSPSLILSSSLSSSSSSFTHHHVPNPNPLLSLKENPRSHTSSAITHKHHQISLSLSLKSLTSPTSSQNSNFSRPSFSLFFCESPPLIIIIDLRVSFTLLLISSFFHTYTSLVVPFSPLL